MQHAIHRRRLNGHMCVLSYIAELNSYRSVTRELTENTLIKRMCIHQYLIIFLVKGKRDCIRGLARPLGPRGKGGAKLKFTK